MEEEAVVCPETLDLPRTCPQRGNQTSSRQPAQESHHDLNEVSGKRPKVTKAVMLIQQCTSARLQVAPPSLSRDSQFVEIGKGVVIFVCFLKDASDETVQRMARLAMNIKLSGDYTKRVSVLELPGDVLIAPQSTLGGRPKGRRMGYHRILDKAEGCRLYEMFAQRCREIMQEKDRSSKRVVRCGAYYNKHEAFTLHTNGPYAHLFEF